MLNSNEKEKNLREKTNIKQPRRNYSNSSRFFSTPQLSETYTKCDGQPVPVLKKKQLMSVT